MIGAALVYWLAPSLFLQATDSLYSQLHLVFIQVALLAAGTYAVMRLIGKIVDKVGAEKQSKQQ